MGFDGVGRNGEPETGPAAAESNFLSEANTGLAGGAAVHSIGVVVDQVPVKGGSVPFSRMTWNWSG